MQVKLRLHPGVAAHLDEVAGWMKSTRSGAISRLLAEKGRLVTKGWIVKCVDEYAYMSGEGGGGCWGREQHEAKRFETCMAALAAASEAALESPVGSCVRVVKLKGWLVDAGRKPNE